MADGEKSTPPKTNIVFDSIVKDIKTKKKEEKSEDTIDVFLSTFFAPLLRMSEDELRNIYGCDEYMHCIEAAKFLKKMAIDSGISIQENTVVSREFTKFLSLIKQSGGKVDF